jgi:hypothetical protein
MRYCRRRRCVCAVDSVGECEGTGDDSRVRPRPWPPIADPDVARSKRGKVGEVVREFVADEIAATLSISPGAAKFRVNLATTLAGPCRATAAALEAG